LRNDDFFACKLIVFSATLCEKSKKSQALRMTRGFMALQLFAGAAIECE
jgi:hypothetical protein